MRQGTVELFPLQVEALPFQEALPFREGETEAQRGEGCAQVPLAHR